MANIMLTYRCNLQCPYCFANEFVNRTDCDISEEDFRTAAAFAAQQPGAQIGLIGGEPTIHPQLEQFIRILTENKNVSAIMLYTNGLHLKEVLPLCKDPRIAPLLRILVNCNAPQVIGQPRYGRLLASLDQAFFDAGIGQHIKFGLNLYDNDFDYSFIKDLLRRYDQYQLRISLTVPDFSVCGKVDAVEHFKSRKDYLLRFFREMDDIGVLPYYDCNHPPVCIWTDEEWNWLQWYRNKYRHLSSNIAEDHAVCHPVVDILPDLRAVRCFGMSDFEKVKITDFDCLSDLQNYFRNRVDAEAFRLCSSGVCRDCYDRTTGRCTGGCIGYKEHTLRQANTFIDARFERIKSTISFSTL